MTLSAPFLCESFLKSRNKPQILLLILQRPQRLTREVVLQPNRLTPAEEAVAPAEERVVPAMEKVALEERAKADPAEKGKADPVGKADPGEKAGPVGGGAARR